MDYINSLLLKLSEKQKNIVLNIRPDFQITLAEYIKNILIKHVDEEGYVTVKGEKVSLENYVNNIIYRNSSIVEKFIYRNGGTNDHLIHDLENYTYGSNQAKENEMDYTLTCCNSLYSNKELEDICIKDIIGTLCENSNFTISQMLDSLYSGVNEYSSRNNNLLNSDINDNIRRINDMDPLEVVMIGDKYYLKSDGHHRIYYLLLCYLMEKSKCLTPEDIELIDFTYTFKFNVTKKLDNDLVNMISYAMIKSHLEDFKVLFVDKQTGKMRIEILNEEIDINNDDELINEFEKYLQQSNNENLINTLNSIGFFEKVNIDLKANQAKEISM